MKCELCFHHCEIKEGAAGFCKARGMRNGVIVPLHYGKITSLSLDPIEKKPLAQFHPGSMILSVGSMGCNFHCDFCQNASISMKDDCAYEQLSVKEVVSLALQLQTEGNIGIAYTYNEPLIGYEFVKDCAQLAHEYGLKNVVVTNGAISSKYMMDLLPYIDAMNIDLKAFDHAFYSRLQGNLEQVKENIILCSTYTHVELTTLIIPGRNDEIAQMEQEAAWIASIDPDIPLHITRYFPHFECTIPSTAIPTIHTLCETAARYLHHVYQGNC